MEKMEKIEFPYFYILTSFFKWIHFNNFEFYGKNVIGKKRIPPNKFDFTNFEGGK